MCVCQQSTQRVKIALYNMYNITKSVPDPFKMRIGLVFEYSSW